MAKAKVTQLPLTAALNAQLNTVNKTIGNQKDRGIVGKHGVGTTVELTKLREALKAESRRASSKKAQAVMADIKTRYGNKELQKAIREFNITFQGIQRSPAEGKRPATRSLPPSGPKGR